MKKAILYLTLLAIAACDPAPKAPGNGPSAPAEKTNEVFPWMHGKWIIDYGEVKVYENWEQVSNKLLKGSSYAVKGTDTMVTEQIQVEKIGADWVFIAKINDGAPVLFSTSQAETDTVLVFENPEHDYPQRVIYGKNEKGELYAIIDGNHEGEPKKEAYNFTRLQ